MKVLFLSNEHGLDGPLTAYTHRLKKLSDALRTEGFETDFLSLREQRFGRPILLQALNAPALRKRIQEYDFVHAGGDAAYTAVLLKGSSGARVIHDVHGDTVSEAHLEWTLRPRVKQGYCVLQSWVATNVAYGKADYFLTVSTRLTQHLQRNRRIASERVALVRNGVDLDVFPESPKLARGAFTVCYAGGMQAWQGTDRLVQAMELLPENGVRLRMIGFGADDRDIKQRIAGRLAARAELIDRVPHEELQTHVNGANILVIPRFAHPAIEVALPTKFAEYLALAKPVIVCDVDETAELVRRHRCGLVSKPGAEALSRTIRKASMMSDSELRAMGENGRRLAEREFCWKKIGRDYAATLSRWRG